MKLGLLTDIHECVEPLRIALERFREEGVDQIVHVGDVFQMGERIEETCRLLAAANAIGVWGNHDVGLCLDPPRQTRSRYSPFVIEYMMSLAPRLDVAGCHFSHIEPWLNPEEIADLWYYEGPPDEHKKLDRIFNAVPHRVMFAGHYHKWLLANPDDILDWHGDRPVQLDSGRYFVVLGALCEGQFAIFDTDSSELIPFSLPASPL